MFEKLKKFFFSPSPRYMDKRLLCFKRHVFTFEKQSQFPAIVRFKLAIEPSREYEQVGYRELLIRDTALSQRAI